MFSPPGLNSWFFKVSLRKLQFENLDAKNGMLPLTDCEFTKNVVTPVISLFPNSNNCVGVRISSEKDLSKVAWAGNLLKYHQHHQKQENLKTYAGILFSRWIEQLRISIHRAYSYTWTYLYGRYPKRMLFRFKPSYPVSVTKLTFALIWPRDYIS